MLNANKLPKPESKFPRPKPLDPGSYPARLVGVVSLGVQKSRPFKGEEKPPALVLRVTYEMLDEFMKDETGADVPTKPRWLSEEFPFYSLSADLAKSTKRYFALDAEQAHKGDWTKLIGAPCMITVVQEADKRPGNNTIYEKIASVSAMRPKEAVKAPDLVNPPFIFDFYEPDMEVFNNFPEWVQEKIMSAVDYPGSALEKATGKTASKPVTSGITSQSDETTAPEEDAW